MCHQLLTAFKVTLHIHKSFICYTLALPQDWNIFQSKGKILAYRLSCRKTCVVRFKKTLYWYKSIHRYGKHFSQSEHILVAIVSVFVWCIHFNYIYSAYVHFNMYIYSSNSSTCIILKYNTAAKKTYTLYYMLARLL